MTVHTRTQVPFAHMLPAPNTVQLPQHSAKLKPRTSHSLPVRCLNWAACCGAQPAIFSLSAPFKVATSIIVFWARGVWTQTTAAWSMCLFLQVWQWQKPPRSCYTSGTTFKQLKVLLLIQNVSKMAVLQIRHRKK